MSIIPFNYVISDYVIFNHIISNYIFLTVLYLTMLYSVPCFLSSIFSHFFIYSSAIINFIKKTPFFNAMWV